MIKINVSDRNYQQVTYSSLLETNIQHPPIDNPIKHKLLNNDIFTYDQVNKKVTILQSPIRSKKDIPCVLLLHGNNTYGRKKDKLLYRCIPNDITIPSFLVPYDTKSLPFSKVAFNQYVTVNFTSWNEKEKHPYATISQVIGSVFNKENFYEYQIYCREVNDSLQKTTKDTSKALEKHGELLDTKEILKNYPQIEKRTNVDEWFVFTIDPSGSTDLDDAYSIKTINDTTKEYMISIYIPNVPLYIDILDLWESLSDRVSTIYLPNKKRPMLPPILSESLFSLLANSSPKCAFTMDIIIRNIEVIDIKLKTTLVKISKNYAYEETELIKNKHYKLLFDITTNLLFKTYKYIDEINDSHDLVAYLMIFMNYKCGVRLKDGKGGIFRATVKKELHTTRECFSQSNDKNGENQLSKVDKEVSNFLKIWNGTTSGGYVSYSDIKNVSELYHNILNMEAYIHITSPIRRLIDILNMIQYIKIYDMLDLSEKAYDFYNKKCDVLGTINHKMKQTRKLQTECELLDMISTVREDLFERKFKGYNFHKKKSDKSVGFFENNVYLPELKIVTKVICDMDMEEYDMNLYSLYLFEDENRFNRKIRVGLCK